MRRKNKSGSQSVSASANGDDGSAISKSSKKSFVGKLLKKKSKKSKKSSASQNENDTAINTSQEADKQTEVQKAFLKNGAEAKKPYMLKIALLLVDAKTRRFELLQLEFDSDKALVSDALSQIPIHVTEKVLSSQTYTGVCGASGIERKRSVPLFDFCKGNDVLVAIPSGTSAEECARLAKPILSDEKVIGMVSSAIFFSESVICAPTSSLNLLASAFNQRNQCRPLDNCACCGTTIHVVIARPTGTKIQRIREKGRFFYWSFLRCNWCFDLGCCCVRVQNKGRVWFR